MKTIARELALAALEIGAIKLQPRDPFTWVSGQRHPIYNDNRLLFGKYENRLLVAKGLVEMIAELGLLPQVIAGVATGGIAPAVMVANELKLPFAYIREKPKAHGVRRIIEGLYPEGDRSVIIEDLVSTGKSSIAALLAAREAKLLVDDCCSIFNYGFSEAVEQFTAQNARAHSLLTFQDLLRVAADARKISAEDVKMLEDWSEDPHAWGARHGFSKVEN